MAKLGRALVLSALLGAALSACVYVPPGYYNTAKGPRYEPGGVYPAPLYPAPNPYPPPGY